MLTRADVSRALLALPLLAGACGRQTEGEISMAAEPSADILAKVAARRTVFAHQSVGDNILDGVRALAAEQNAPLSIVETREPPAALGLYHFKVGANEDPRGKIADFAATMAKLDVDAALLKLCYVDFKSSTDGAALAGEYVAALDMLRAEKPTTRFIAVTAPLTTLPSAPKEWIKGLLGRASPAPAENASRLAFNRVLRERFGGGALFDIARLEAGALSADGVEYMRAGITDDGGHLNAQGQRLAAAEFLRCLSA